MSDRSSPSDAFMPLLHQIQSAAARYADARIGYDAAVEKCDLGAKTLHWERLLEAHAEWVPLAAQFTEKYSFASHELTEGTVVVWRNGTVGMEGILTHLASLPLPGASDVLATVVTTRGMYCEFARNLMPLSCVG